MKPPPTPKDVTDLYCGVSLYYIQLVSQTSKDVVYSFPTPLKFEGKNIKTKEFFHEKRGGKVRPYLLI